MRPVDQIVLIHTVMGIQMIDLHNHVLFGMDDGAQTLEDSIQMIKSAIDQGIKTLVLTSHFNPITDDYDLFITKRNANFLELQDAVNFYNLDINLLKGAEVYFSSALLTQDLDALCIEGTDYLLIELSTRSMPASLNSQILTLLGRGYKVILAHIERYQYLIDDSQELVSLVENGVLMQVNCKTFLRGKDKHLIKALIKHNLVHLIASDAHNMDSRIMNTGETFEFIDKHFSKLVSKRFMSNAQAVLSNRYPEILMPTKLKTRFGRYV